MNDPIFHNDTLVLTEKLAADSRSIAQGLTPARLTLLGNTLVCLGVFAFEYEVFYGIFVYLAGEDHAFWTPWIMGCSSMVIVMALHTMVTLNERHFALGFIDRLAAGLVPIYLLGIGLVLAAMIFQGGLKEMLSVDTGALDFSDLSLDSVSEERSWMDELMDRFIMPTAALLFSAGIGALAIINVFVAHHCMDTVQAKLGFISEAQRMRHADDEDLAIYKAQLAQYEVLQAHLDQAALMDDDTLRLALAHDLLLEIKQAIVPAQKALIQLSHEPESHALDFLPHAQTLTPKELEKSIKVLSAIDTDTLMQHMH